MVLEQYRKTTSERVLRRRDLSRPAISLVPGGPSVSLFGNRPTLYSPLELFFNPAPIPLLRFGKEKWWYNPLPLDAGEERLEFLSRV